MKKYKTIYLNGKSIYYHRWLYEQHYNITIPDGYIVHHIDEDIHNNDISNLQMMTRSEHVQLHSREGRNFNNINGINREQKRNYQRSDKYKEYRRQYCEKNKEKIKQYKKEYRERTKVLTKKNNQ